MDKIKIGIVNYLNTKPLLYGITHSKIIDAIELISDYPSNIARMLLDGTIDAGLVPVVVMDEMKEYYFISDFCIGCNGPVSSVCLFSDVPVGEIERVIPDNQSRTSNELLRVLLKYYWKLNPEYQSPQIEYTQNIRGTTAALVIGDRSFAQRKISKYTYDLGEAWKNLTGLPFVFAAWISNKQLNALFISSFNDANRYGIQNIEKVIEENPMKEVDLYEYFTNYISYEWNDEKKKGLQRFMEMRRDSL